jgi:hypothetical protein
MPRLREFLETHPRCFVRVGRTVRRTVSRHVLGGVPQDDSPLINSRRSRHVLGAANLPGQDSRGQGGGHPGVRASVGGPEGTAVIKRFGATPAASVRRLWLLEEAPPMSDTENGKIAMTLPRPVLRRLDELAEGDGRTRSAFVRWVVTEAVRLSDDRAAATQTVDAKAA